ncbi:Na+/H+ antiporter NhaA [Paenalcaligenes niemegkensis]|uniref:Na+/H+ antiporter NhaA n=1 Tax=Paenalcaligenes niemegkensis TaxID=2895469 RepID=UPI001EE948A5|nr:Na+/H+ antiporter NhaA [Paenalcaligenes niemegkensis]MCQ9616503.1 Na+/H+ antiporter NhaA [Paenalcaligenes niemegkensis]
MRTFLGATQRILQIEAVSGAVLIAAAMLALMLANSPAAASYHGLWSSHLSLGLGGYSVSQPLHFWVNDALMTVFFLVVGMEIRSEIHNGALSTLRTAALPLAAALGGVLVPAFVYLSLNTSGEISNGWAVPTATDIAFAVGVLALLGRSIPSNVRILLLAVAIIDDIVAVLIIAFFYSGGLDVSGLPWVAGGIVLVLTMQKLGLGAAYLYVLPGAMLWFGLLKIGAHPTLAGVILGLMTPVMAKPLFASASTVLKQESTFLAANTSGVTVAEQQIAFSLNKMREVQREILPPVSRVQMSLHPWVAFVVMPIFALANAGVTVGGVDLSAVGAQSVMLGVIVALVIGKPLGIFLLCQVAVRSGLCQLPPGVTWGGVLLVGLFAGIGFTMSIFIGTLAFTDENLLNAAKLGVLIASLTAALVGLGWGFSLRKRLKKQRECSNNVQ